MKNITLITIVFFALIFPYLTFGQGYKNPVIPGFYPDPSICKVSDDYYLVSSTFEYFPGVPVFHSKDLINWNQIGHCLTRKSQLPFEKVTPSQGIYAPTLRYHNGVFYMVTTLMISRNENANFYVTATNPAGPWSDPIYVDQSGIDPSLFWDDDGKVYFQSNRATSFDDARAIYQSEIDIKTGEILSEIKMLWTGSGAQYIEAPHVYKKDGYYYLMTAEGGTFYNHQVTIARSKNIWGPYEGCPHNPILTARNSYDVIQGTGHGDLIEAHDGSWWMVFLCIRPTVGNCPVLGRETSLVPVEWKNGWPVVNETGVATAQMDVPTLPLKPFPEKSTLTEFDEKELGLEWNYIRNPVASNYSLDNKQGSLALKGEKWTLSDALGEITFVGRRIQHWSFSAETELVFAPKADNETAGICIMSRNNYHYDLFLQKRNNQQYLVLEYRIGSITHREAEIPVEGGSIKLKIGGKKTFYEFSYAENGSSNYHTIASVDSRFMSADVSGGYTGPYVGLFASGNGEKSTAWAYYDWFKYQEKGEL
ncbi:glycoside hydrolase family 43 protein [Sunxiuqinia elliptica]|uniref:Alpha-N-arabinofuranosidase n=1 Tax=Sunxiuqinia elliptica TaxID=655355 RepID=A0A1I2GUC0_9BACT|nr:glycoside hydrolase family 43 protein [Sunxiuqinia elliptica]SFF20649.1 alpha-N-arabinofuranosidase [Sunxiuqinia elliptica]